MTDFVFPYTGSELTEQVNIIPNAYGMINALNIFPDRSISSRNVVIDRVQGRLRVLAAQPLGAPGPTARPETGAVTIIAVPYIPHTDQIGVADIQDVLQGNGVRTNLATVTASKLAAIRRKHGVTREYMRVQALKGVVKDGDGATLFDPFTVFSITQKSVDFALATSTTDVIAKCEEVMDHIQSNISDDTTSGTEMIVSSEFFNKLVQHPKVEKYWVNSQNGALLANMERQRLGGSWGRVFEFQNIVFREYKGSVPVKSGSERLVLANEGHAYPVGTGSSFETVDVPAWHLEAANSAPTDTVFISTEPLKHGEGVEMKSQSNCLPIAKRPEVLVKVSTN